jgi:hypothetical protein
MDSELYTQWTREGYLVVRGLWDADRTERLRAICEAILAQWRQSDPQTGQPGGGPDATSMRHLNHPGYFTHDPQAFREVMEAAADERVLAISRAILGEEPLFRCTSLFMNPTQTSMDGDWHRDTQFLIPQESEERAFLERGMPEGEAIQLQIALVASEDIEFVPGSHLRWDTPEEYRIRLSEGRAHCRSNAMPGGVRIGLQPGDAVAFNPFGLHRGRYHADKLRRTLMLTYTKRSQPRYDYFSDQPWFLEPGYLEGLTPRARAFFETFIAVYAPFWRERHAPASGMPA